MGCSLSGAREGVFRPSGEAEKYLSRRPDGGVKKFHVCTAGYDVNKTQEGKAQPTYAHGSGRVTGRQ